VTDLAYRTWQASGKQALPDYFVDARSLAPRAHLGMQAALQPFVDNAISKTINIPEDYSFEDFRSLYEDAYREGLKGCTTFRPTPVRGEILLAGGNAAGEEGALSPHCCSIEREAD